MHFAVTCPSSFSRSCLELTSYTLPKKKREREARAGRGANNWPLARDEENDCQMITKLTRQSLPTNQPARRLWSARGADNLERKNRQWWAT